MKNLLLIVLFTACSFVVLATEKETKKESKAELAEVSLDGVIVDKITNEPLVGVKVALEGTDKVVYTDFDGNYSFENLMPGDYKVSANYVSYQHVSGKNVKLNGKENRCNLDLKMIN